MLKNPRRLDRGSTLIEALVAWALLALLVLFVMRPLSAADQATAQVASRRAAISLAYQLMDQAQTCPAGNLRSGKGSRVLCYSSAHGQQNVACQWTSEVTELSDGRFWLKVNVTMPNSRPVTLESERVILGMPS